MKTELREGDRSKGGVNEFTPKNPRPSAAIIGHGKVENTCEDKRSVLYTKMAIAVTALETIKLLTSKGRMTGIQEVTETALEEIKNYK